MYLGFEVVHPTDPLKRNPQQLLRFDRKFHRQLLQHFLGKAVDDQRHGFLGIQSALHRVEHLVVGNLARRRLMLDLRAGVADFDIGDGVRAAQRPEQQRIALGEIAHALGIGRNAHQPAIGVVAVSGADAL